MWLINAETYKLELFLSHDAWEHHPYAILSHTWEDDEVSFQDIQNLEYARSKAGFWKIRHTCEQAKLDGLEYAWVDACCIDKSSSAELQEAINSMFGWYGRAKRCYAYLNDLTVDTTAGRVAWLTEFEASRWFTRGWTLQELIAPRNVHFYNKHWKYVGSRAELEYDITLQTKIDIRFLCDAPLPEFGNRQTDRTMRPNLGSSSVAKRMSWAAARSTTRIEDRAYSLLGLFQVNMPMLYGEGLRAFTRLQEEILRSTSDMSILLWEDIRKLEDHNRYDNIDNELLAPSPSYFVSCGHIHFVSTQQSVQSTAERIVSSVGIKTSMRVIHGTTHGDLYILLDCYDERDLTRTVALHVTPVLNPASSAYNSETLLLMSAKEFFLHPRAKSRTRTTKIDALEAEDKCRTQAVALARNRSSCFVYANPVADWTYPSYNGRMKGSGALQMVADGVELVWLRLERGVGKTRWLILQMYPREAWDLSRLTFKATECYDNNLSHSMGGRDVPFLTGSIALQDRDFKDRMIAISFACLVHDADNSGYPRSMASSHRSVYFRLDRFRPEAGRVTTDTLRSLCQDVVSTTVPGEFFSWEGASKGLVLRENAPVPDKSVFAITLDIRSVGPTRSGILQADSLSSLEEMETQTPSKL